MPICMIHTSTEQTELKYMITAENQMQKLGISGVPFYIINNKYGVSGAQTAKTFSDAFNQLGLEMQPAGGDACSVDDPNC